MSEQVPTTEPVERRLPITAQQADLLARAQAAALTADRNLQLIGAAILAGHHLATAQLVAVEEGPVLVVRVKA